MALRFEDETCIKALPEVVGSIRTKEDAERHMPLIYTPDHLNRKFDGWDDPHNIGESPVDGQRLRWTQGQSAPPQFWADLETRGKKRTVSFGGPLKAQSVLMRRWWNRRWFPKIAETLVLARRAHDAMLFALDLANPALRFPKFHRPSCSFPNDCSARLRTPSTLYGRRWHPCVHCAWKALTRFVCELVEFDKRYLYTRFTRFAVETAEFLETDWEFFPELAKAIRNKGRRWRGTGPRYYDWLHIAFDARYRYREGRGSAEIHELVRDIIEAYRLLDDDDGGRRDGKVKRFLREQGWGAPKPSMPT